MRSTLALLVLGLVVVSPALAQERLEAFVSDVRTRWHPRRRRKTHASANRPSADHRVVVRRRARRTAARTAIPQMGIAKSASSNAPDPPSGAIDKTRSMKSM